MENSNLSLGNAPGLSISASKPVSAEENAEVKGMALAGEVIFQGHLKKIGDLRKRQAEYIEQLPTEPSEKLRSIKGLLEGSYDSFPDEAYKALHFSVVLEHLVKHGDLEPHSPDQTATAFIAEMLSDNLQALQKKLRGAWDVATN
jgi:hypothetical protein